MSMRRLILALPLDIIFMIMQRLQEGNATASSFGPAKV